MNHIPQKSLPFLASKNFINARSLLIFFNIPVKNMVLVSLLMTGSVIVSSIPESRNLNGTPLEKATESSTDTVLQAAKAAATVILCSYVADAFLASFDATKDMPNRGNIASGTCATLYTSLYASFKYQEMKKNEEIKMAEEKNAENLRKAEESEKTTWRYWLTNEKTVYYSITNYWYPNSTK